MNRIILCTECSSQCLLNSDGELLQGEFNICCRSNARIKRPIHNTRTLINNNISKNRISKTNIYKHDSLFPHSCTLE